MTYLKVLKCKKVIINGNDRYVLEGLVCDTTSDLVSVFTGVWLDQNIATGNYNADFVYENGRWVIDRLTPFDN